MNSETKIRHCAYCLNSIAVEAVKLCGKCLKRAYCSRGCQVADWTLKKKGQGHKNWCHLGCGEEDLDWEVAAVPGKGLGLIAKRMIPANFRIIVDGCRPKDHPAIEDLMPLNGTFEEKFGLNRLGTDNEGSVLCLRISRANHKCNPNADHVYDEMFKVKILFSVKDIQAGEEICITYARYNDISKNITAQVSRNALNSIWGIVCPEDCFCYDKQVDNIIAESRELDWKIPNLASKLNIKSANAALAAVNELLENHEIMQSSWLDKKRTLYDGFQIAIMRKKTQPQAQTFIRKIHEIDSSIMSPESSEVVQIKTFIEDFKSHSNYLILER